MDLLNNLFQIVDRSEMASGYLVRIRLYADHIIFKGHFPGHPIMPGVILLQIVHELTQLHLNKKIRLAELSTCKFLKLVNPEKEDLMTISTEILLQDQSLRVKASGKNDSGIFFKLDAHYSVVNT